MNVPALFVLNPDLEDRQSIASNIGLSKSKLAIPEQIHSSTIKYINQSGHYSGVDGFLTDYPGIILTLKVADCVPVYLYASNTNMISLVHSGWRGTVGGIVSNAVKLMLESGADKKDIMVFLGPAIGICCYEVDGEVASKFNEQAKLKLNDVKWKVSLHREIRFQLSESNIPSANIMASDICTYESLDCHSYRRDGAQAGQMFAFMWLSS